MLGMMNCPTDNVEFYSASPSSRRSQLNITENNNNSSSSEAGSNKQLNVEEDETVRVFTEVKDRPQITYSEDGRKFVNGKLADSSNTYNADPMKMWDKLILSKVCEQQNNLKCVRKSDDKSSDCSTALGHTMSNLNIQPSRPITVSSAKPYSSAVSLPEYDSMNAKNVKSSY